MLAKMRRIVKTIRPDRNNMRLATAAFDNITVSSVPPPAPILLTSMPAWRTVTLTWGGPLTADSFNVKRSRTSGGPYGVIATGVAANSYTDRGLDDGTPHYYVVSSTNLSGESADSNQPR
jgi:fibronectin type 3 domain-containing protein